MTTATGRPRGRPPGSRNRKTVAKKKYVPLRPPEDYDWDTLVRDCARRDATTMSRAAARMATVGWFSYEEIAERLGYASAAHARAAVASFVSRGFTPEDAETLRVKIIAELERSVQRASRMAAAAYLVDEDGTMHENSQRMSWHDALRKDLEVLARISGAQAATELRLLNPESAELDDIVRALEIRDGRVAEEPGVLVLETLDVEEPG